jgi:hypothetical protein
MISGDSPGGMIFPNNKVRQSLFSGTIAGGIELDSNFVSFYISQINAVVRFVPGSSAGRITKTAR